MVGDQPNFLAVAWVTRVNYKPPMIAVALGVLRVEAIRQAAAAGRALDAPLLLEAIRQSDLLMVHLSSGADLVRRLPSRHVE